PTWPARSWPHAASAPPRCPIRTRSTPCCRRPSMSVLDPARTASAPPAMITAAQFESLRRTRAAHPERIAEAYAARTRRPLLTDGRLFIVAADHPARGALKVRDDAMAMADRYDLLNRI